MFDFASIANQKVEDIKRPPNPPVGHYIFQITKTPESRKSKDETYEFLSFQCVAVEAGPDVDLEDLQAYGELKNIRLPKEFIFNRTDETAAQNEMNKLKAFLEKHVQCSGDGMSIKEALQASVNQRFMGELRWRDDKEDPEIKYAFIGKTSPVA